MSRSERPRSRVAQASTTASLITLALTLVVPLLIAVVLTRVAHPRPTAVDTSARSVPLERIELGCPTARAVSVLVGSTDGTAGTVSFRPGDSTRSLAAGHILRHRPPDPVTVVGTQQVAPGLTALAMAGTAAAACTSPAAETWFAGVGASPGHASVVELSNPDAGPAVVDITVFGPRGPVDVPDIRGIRVPGGTTASVDLAATLPRRGELSLHLVVSRGRLVSRVRDRVQEIGEPARVEWQPGQAAAATSLVLPGLPPGRGERTVVLANGGADETLAEVRFITRTSSFVPTGLDSTRVPPGATVAVDLGPLWSPDVIGIQVEADAPVIALARSLVGSELTLTAAAPALQETAATPLPPGENRLVLAGARSAGTVVVTTRDARGRQLRRRRVSIAPERALPLALPERAAFVRIDVGATGVSAAVVLADASVVPLTDVLREQVVPAVRPVLPR